MQVRRCDEHHLMPWANGAGVTAEIGTGPNGREGGDWAWRLSVADVSEDGPFSVLPGVDRHIIVADGVGMELTIDGIRHRLSSDSPPLSFSGEAVSSCRLIDGPIIDLNLMIRRSLGVGALISISLVAGQPLEDAELVGAYPTVGLVIISGGAMVDAIELASQDALLFDSGEGLPNLVAIGPCRLAVATMALRGVPFYSPFCVSD